MHFFKVAGLPPTQTHQSRLRAFKIGQYCRLIKIAPDAKTKALQDKIRSHLALLRGNKRYLCPAGPVHLKMDFIFPWPQGTSKALKAKYVRRTQRPDLDNMAKSILDALTDGGAWADDAQVTSLFLSKYNGPEPLVAITISPNPKYED